MNAPASTIHVHARDLLSVADAQSEPIDTLVVDVGDAPGELGHVRRFRGLRSLIIVTRQPADLSRLGHDTVPLLQLHQPSDTLQLEQFPSVKTLLLHWSEGQTWPHAMTQLEVLSLSGLGVSKDGLRILPEMTGLTKLLLVKPRCATLAGLAPLPALRWLELHHLKRGFTLQRIADFPTLIRVAVSHCPDLVDVHALSACGNLEFLLLENCRAIPNLSFLSHLPNLKGLGLKRTYVQDGDLSLARSVANKWIDRRPWYRD